MNWVKVAVIGCGNISAAYLKAAKTFPILDIVALSDLNLSPSRLRLGLRGFWDLGAHGFVRLFHRLTTDTFANALEG